MGNRQLNMFDPSLKQRLEAGTVPETKPLKQQTTPIPPAFLGLDHGEPLYIDEKRVGVIQGAWLWKTGIDPAKHKVKRPPGWALDVSHFLELVRRGTIGVALVMQSGDVLSASVADFSDHGHPLNRGYGDQINLVDKYWVKQRKFI